MSEFLWTTHLHYATMGCSWLEASNYSRETAIRGLLPNIQISVRKPRSVWRGFRLLMTDSGIGQVRREET